MVHISWATYVVQVLVVVLLWWVQFERDWSVLFLTRFFHRFNCFDKCHHFKVRLARTFVDFGFCLCFLRSVWDCRADYNAVFDLIPWAEFSSMFVKREDLLVILDGREDSLVISHPLLTWAVAFRKNLILHLTRWQRWLRLNRLRLVYAVYTVGCFLINPLTRVMVSRTCAVPICRRHIVHKGLHILFVNLWLTANTLRWIHVIWYSLFSAQHIKRHLLSFTGIGHPISFPHDVWSEYFSLTTNCVLILWIYSIFDPCLCNPTEVIDWELFEEPRGFWHWAKLRSAQAIRFRGVLISTLLRILHFARVYKRLLLFLRILLNREFGLFCLVSVGGQVGFWAYLVLLLNHFCSRVIHLGVEIFAFL